MAIIKETTKAGKDEVKKEHFHLTAGNVSYCRSLWKSVWRGPQNLKNLRAEQPYGPAISLKKIHLKESKLTHHKDSYTSMVPVVQFRITKIWHHPRSLPTTKSTAKENVTAFLCSLHHYS